VATGLLRARCLVVEPLGSHNLLTVQAGPEQLKVATHPGSRVRADDEVLLRIDPRRIRWLDPDTGRAIEG
jgi:multiple sugar transport system ATP-binding protein